MTEPAAAAKQRPRRQELLLAAFDQLADRGFEGLRTRDVAAAAGVNVATLHYYFPTKETLIAGVLEHAMERFRTTITPSSSHDTLLRSHFAGVRRLARSDPTLFAVMGELALRSARDPAIAVLFERMLRSWQAAMRAMILHTTVGGGKLSGREADAQAAMAVAAVMGACMLPGDRDARLAQTLRQLERQLGVSS
jgi:AcrR family transcriptional regulator